MSDDITRLRDHQDHYPNHPLDLGCVEALNRIEAEVARLTAERAETRAALRKTHGVAQAMADLDPWIASECGMVDEGTSFYVPAARAALAATVESEPET